MVANQIAEGFFHPFLAVGERGGKITIIKGKISVLMADNLDF